MMSFLSSCVSSSANHCMRHHGLRPSDAIFLSLERARRILKISKEDGRGSWALAAEVPTVWAAYGLKATRECHSAPCWCSVTIAVHSSGFTLPLPEVTVKEFSLWLAPYFVVSICTSNAASP